MTSSIRILLSALSAATALGAQTVWIVDVQNGPGTSFQTLIAAVNSPLVQPGDILAVRPGDYSPVVIRRSLSVLGNGRVTGTLRVEGIGLADSVTIAGLQLTSLDIANCAGIVVVDHLAAPFAVSNAIAITNSQRVFVQRCPIVATLTATDSTVHLNSMSLASWTFGPMLSVTRSVVCATDCTLGMLGPFVPVAPIQLANGVLSWAGPDPMLAFGGNPPAIVDGTGFAAFDAALTWTPGVPLATAGVTVSRPSLPVAVVTDVAGGYRSELVAAPGTLGLLAVGHRGQGVATPFGTSWLDPGQPANVLAFGLTDAQGRLAAVVALPPAPALFGFDAVFQAVSLTAGFVLTNAVQRTVGG